MSKFHVRRCAACDHDWPAAAEYNLCPRCQRNTYASTDDTVPNYADARKLAARYEAVRAFDAKADAAHAKARQAWNFEMNTLLAQTTSIPGPPAAGWPTDPQRPTNPQDVRFKLPTDDEIGRWVGDDA